MFTPILVLLWSTPLASPSRVAEDDALRKERVIAAAHTASLDDETLTVHTTLRHREDADGNGPLWLAHPLPAGSTVNGNGSAPVLDSEHRLIGVALSADDEVVKEEHVARVVFRVPHAVPAERLHMPLFAAPLERVTLTGIAFAPDAALALEPRLGHTAPAHVTREDRHWLARAVSDDAPHGSIFVTPEIAARGLIGSVERVATQRRRTAGIAMLVAAFVILTLGIAHRKLSRAALAERVDKVLDGTLDEFP